MKTAKKWPRCVCAAGMPVAPKDMETYMVIKGIKVLPSRAGKIEKNYSGVAFPAVLAKQKFWLKGTIPKGAVELAFEV